jgi:peptide/nickel transport system ATP-binding protein
MDSIPKLADPSGTRLTAIAGRPPDLINPPTGCKFAPRCPYAQQKCRDAEPPLRTVGSPDHLFACWFPLVNGQPTAPEIAAAAPVAAAPVAAASDVGGAAEGGS